MYVTELNSVERYTPVWDSSVQRTVMMPREEATSRHFIIGMTQWEFENNKALQSIAQAGWIATEENSCDPQVKRLRSVEEVGDLTDWGKVE